MSDIMYSKVRKEILKAIKIDLMGPMSEEEELDESPLSAYITGMLHPRQAEVDEETEFEEAEFITGNGEDNSNYAVGSDEDEEQEQTSKKFKQQSSIGLRFYVNDSINELAVCVHWGTYEKKIIESEIEGKDGTPKKTKRTRHVRRQVEVSYDFTLDSFSKTKKVELEGYGGIYLTINKYLLPNGFKLVSIHLSNERENNNSRDYTTVMFQTELVVKSADYTSIFEPEHKCRQIELDDEYFYEDRPVFARGYGCAANWNIGIDFNACSIRTEFIPEHEINSVSPIIEGIDVSNFSMRQMSQPKNRQEIIQKLRLLNSSYKDWIDKLENDERMSNIGFKERGKKIISHCEEAYNRIEKGISLIESDDTVLDAFCFMNQAMYLQWGIKKFAQKHSTGAKCSLGDFTKEDNVSWRPFQLAFILMNIEGSINPESEDRDIVDLLYFPTGGGKTEAYLGIIAMVIAYRRLTSNPLDQFEKDGGVTIILRYTLRLLTTQQRDRLTKLIVAAELLRERKPEKYGHSRISIGFYVGGGVTPNNFNEFKYNAEDPYRQKQAYSKLTKQIIVCPLCGTPIRREDYSVNLDTGEAQIHCPSKTCHFYKYKGVSLPIYVVDEEIYRKCPTVIIATVDKFARLPWDEKTGLLFGRTDRYCERHGYLAVGEKHPKRHNKKDNLEKAVVVDAKPFYPPELIVQDELHLITGPLGTIYGGYETIIEELSVGTTQQGKYKPKYVVSTATIKNAKDQIRCLYGRKEYAQFPPSGLDISDSFFMKEVPLPSMDDNGDYITEAGKKPFRLYSGICAPGQSMKTTLLRVYAVILQSVFVLAEKEEYKDYVDPYYTLIGYFNSIRELGGTVRLLQDDIPNRIKRIKKKYGHDNERYISSKYREITSRISSYKIAELLELLSIPCTEKDCLHAAVATNMIAVGMDVDRLGLMTVVGQPKQNSEYIQATSRIGRQYPGLVVTIYNPYRPRDLSHYENFKAFHSQLYRFVEGTTATPFSARARDRVLHALVVALLRLKNDELANNSGANNILEVDEAAIEEVKESVLNKVLTIVPKVYDDVEFEIDQFLDDWKRLSKEQKNLYYYIRDNEKYNRLLNYYGEYCTPREKATLNSMREVESASTLYYHVEGRE